MQPHRETHEMTKTRKCFWRFVRVSGETSGSATDVLVIAPSAATHLTRRPRARNETARGSRLPRLMRLVFCGACGSRGGYLRRLGRRLSRGFGACGRRPCLVFLQTAVLVFSARAAMTWLVAARSFTGLSSHCDECTVPTALERHPRSARLLQRTPVGPSLSGRVRPVGDHTRKLCHPHQCDHRRSESRTDVYGRHRRPTHEH